MVAAKFELSRNLKIEREVMGSDRHTVRPGHVGANGLFHNPDVTFFDSPYRLRGGSNPRYVNETGVCQLEHRSLGIAQVGPVISRVQRVERCEPVVSGDVGDESDTESTALHRIRLTIIADSDGFGSCTASVVFALGRVGRLTTGTRRDNEGEHGKEGK